MGDSFNTALYEEEFLKRTLLFADFSTLTATTSFFEDVSSRADALLADPTTYNGLNLFLLGIPDLLYGTFNPEEPLSFQHTMDILGTLSILFSGAKVLDKLGLDDLGGISLPSRNKGNYLLGKIPQTVDSILQEVAEGLGTVVKKESANITNLEFLKGKPPYFQPPITPDTTVFTIILKNETKFIRNYNSNGSPQVDRWVALPKDLDGLTASQIKDNLALPNLPEFQCEVILPAGTKLEISAANGIMGNQGGSLQFSIREDFLSEDWFMNEIRIN